MPGLHVCTHAVTHVAVTHVAATHVAATHMAVPIWRYLGHIPSHGGYSALPNTRLYVVRLFKVDAIDLLCGRHGVLGSF